MAQQTAVEWLIEQYTKKGYIGMQDELQAKQMEKEQIIECLRYAIQEEYYNRTWANCASTSLAAEKYYEQTYGN